MKERNNGKHCSSKTDVCLHRFTQETANSIVDDQGIDSIEEVGYLKDPDIDDLCKTPKRLGGTIANPNAGNAGQPN